MNRHESLNFIILCFSRRAGKRHFWAQCKNSSFGPSDS